MEISIRDIIKASIKKWYIVLTIVSIFVAMGTAIGVNNYTKPQYTASSSYLFSNVPVQTINRYVSDCRAYLITAYIQNSVSNYIEETYGKDNDYEVTIEMVSMTISITVTANNEEVAKAVIMKYGEIITAPNNPIKKEDLVIEQLVPLYIKPLTPSITSLVIQVALFGFIGVFISGVIIITPLYNQKSKEKLKSENFPE